MDKQSNLIKDMYIVEACFRIDDFYMETISYLLSGIQEILEGIMCIIGQL